MIQIFFCKGRAMETVQVVVAKAIKRISSPRLGPQGSCLVNSVRPQYLTG